MSFPVVGLTPGYQLGIDASFIYTVEPGAIVSVGKNGNSVNGIAVQNGLTGLAFNSTTIFWVQTTGSPVGTGELRSVLKTGGTVTALLTGLSYVNTYGIAADDTNVYWAQWNTGSFSSGVVNQMPVAGGPITTIATGQDFPNAFLAVDAANVYWSQNGGNYGLFQVPIGGGTITTLVPNGSGLFVTQMVSDGTTVFFVNSANPGSVCSVPVGGGAITTLASGQNIPAGLAIFGDGVIWTNQGDSTVWFVAKEGGTVYQAQTSLGSRLSIELGGITLDGTGAYFAGIASGALYYTSIPSIANISGESTFTADGDVQVNPQAFLGGNSSLNLLTANPVAMVQDQANEKMYILDILGPRLIVADTTSLNGLTPPLSFSQIGSIAPIDLNPVLGGHGPLLHKLQFDPNSGSIWLVTEDNFVFTLTVNAAGAVTGSTSAAIPTSGEPVDFAVDQASPGLAFIATDIVSHELLLYSASDCTSPLSAIDYQFGFLDSTSVLTAIDVDTVDGAGILSAVVFDSVGSQFSFGYFLYPPAIGGGIEWSNPPVTFNEALDTVHGLSTAYTIEDVTGGGPLVSLFQGGPPSPSNEAVGPFIGSTFGTNPTMGSFPGFLGPQTQMFFADVVGDIFTTSFPPGGFQYLSTPPNPLTVLYGVPNPDTTYPSGDQSGIWALAPIGSDGFAHLYRFSFTSQTLLDLPFVLPPPIDGGEVIYTTRFFEGDDYSDLAIIPAEVVLHVAGTGVPLQYLLRASCSSAPGGFIFWQNTTGDNTGQPACSGVLGPTFIIASWEPGT